MWEQLDQPPIYSEVDVALQHAIATTSSQVFQEDNGPGKELASFP
jgi:hypothetical protein